MKKLFKIKNLIFCSMAPFLLLCNSCIETTNKNTSMPDQDIDDNYFPSYYHHDYSDDFIDVLLNSSSKRLEIVTLSKNNKYLTRGGVVFESGDYAIYRTEYDFNNNDWFDSNCTYTIDYYNSENTIIDYYFIKKENGDYIVDHSNVYGNEHVIDQFYDLMYHHFFKIYAQDHNKDWFIDPPVENLNDRECYNISFSDFDACDHTYYIDIQYDIILQYDIVSQFDAVDYNYSSNFVNLYDDELPHFIDARSL